jgi:hypothetical protein
MSTLTLNAVDVPIMLQRNTWHCVVFSFDSGLITKVYLDGSEIFSTPRLSGYTFGKATTERQMEVGGWDGVLDDFTIYDKALTSAEVREIYDAEKPKEFIVEVSQPHYAGDLVPNDHTVSASGGTVSSSLSLPSNTQWEFSSDADWITKSGAQTGSGSTSVSLQIQANPSVYDRTAMVNVGAAEMKVTQQGRLVTLNNRAGTFGTDGGSGTIQVSAEAGASWEAKANVDWVVIAAGATGSGAGTVFYVVSPFVGGAPSRTALLNIAGIEYVVSQSGYTISISPSVETISGNGGKGIVNVNANIEAVWNAIVLEPWISIIGKQDGIGNGVLEYVITPNKSGTIRTGTIVIGGQVMTVSQPPNVESDSEAETQLQAAVAEVAQERLSHAQTKAELSSALADAEVKINQGRDEVVNAPGNYGLISIVDADEQAKNRLETGRNEVISSPENYGLISIVDADEQAKNRLETGRNEVISSPENYGLAKLEIVESETATPHTSGWYYQPQWGWIWSSTETFPFLYRSSSGDLPAGWLYFKEGSGPPALFYSFPEEKWVTLSFD